MTHYPSGGPFASRPLIPPVARRPRPVAVKPRRTSVKMPSLQTVLLVALLMAVSSVLFTTLRYQRTSDAFGERMERVTAAAARILDDVRSRMGETEEIFKQDLRGEAVLRMLELPPSALPIEYSRLPRLRSRDAFGREDIPAAATGNALAFAVSAGSRAVRGPSGKSYRLEAYRIDAFYLTTVGKGPQPGSSVGLDLCRFVSVPVVDRSQVEAITVPRDRQRVLRALQQGEGGPAVRHLWHRGGNVTGSLAVIDATGKKLIPVSTLPADPAESCWGLFGSEFSVVTNYAHSSYGVGQLGRITHDRGGFPHGFEIQLGGSAASRLVRIHLCAITADRGGVPGSVAQQTTISTGER
ncbi:MAG: hypothetical protein KDC87_22400 [Planctomycetes bacterium]|nr:hypothetical protein [Planctomycetota bacterium]